MASINTIVKRKQDLWLGIVVDGAESQPDPAGCAGRNAGGAYFLPGQQLVAVPAGKNAGGRRRATEGDRENSRTPRLRR